MKFEALVNTKSKSAIGWENERLIRLFDLLKNKIQYIENIKNNFKEEKWN